MTPYVVTLFLSVALAWLASKRLHSRAGSAGTRLFGFVCTAATAVVLSLVSGLRWGIGADYWRYVSNYYESYRTPFTLSGDMGTEPAIWLLTKASSGIYDHPTTFFVVTAAVTVGLIVWALARQSDNLPLSVYLYITNNSWQIAFNAVRQGAALAVLFAGTTLILKRKLFAFSALVVLASMFHASALALILLYFLPRKRLGPLATAMLFAAALALLNSYEVIAQLLGSMGYQELLTTAYFQEEVNPLRILISLGPYCLYLALVPKGPGERPVHFYGNVMLMNVLVYVAALNSAYLARFAIYTDLYVVLAVPAFLKEIHDGRVRTLVTGVIVALFFAYWFYGTLNDRYLYPYMWIGSHVV